VPFAVDGAALRGMVDAFDIALDRSRVAVAEDGELVGLANLAVRGARGWIGGLGVVAKARRHGIGRRLMESVLDGAPPEVGLEVIEENEPAIRL
jgi:ribosomal-protein-alanine N-acetyltransferase